MPVMTSSAVLTSMLMLMTPQRAWSVVDVAIRPMLILLQLAHRCPRCTFSSLSMMLQLTILLLEQPAACSSAVQGGRQRIISSRCVLAYAAGAH